MRTKSIIARAFSVVSILLILSTTSCGTNNSPRYSNIPGYTFDGSQWKLISINGNELVRGSYISLYFQKEKVWGSCGVNIYGGKYATASPNILNLSQIISTAMGGPDDLIRQEGIYLKNIQSAKYALLSGNQLEITSANNTELLVFERLPEYPENPASLVGTNWQLVSMNDQSVREGLSITLNFVSENGASGEAGCFYYALSYDNGLPDGDDIRWGISSSRVGNLPNELEEQASRYTDSIAWAANYRLTKDRLEIYTARGDRLIYRPFTGG